MLGQGRYEVLANNLPNDARIVSLRVMGLLCPGMIELVLESPVFPSTPPGEPVPDWPAPVIRRLPSDAGEGRVSAAFIEAHLR